MYASPCAVGKVIWLLGLLGGFGRQEESGCEVVEGCGGRTVDDGAGKPKGTGCYEAEFGGEEG